MPQFNIGTHLTFKNYPYLFILLFSWAAMLFLWSLRSLLCVRNIYLVPSLLGCYWPKDMFKRELFLTLTASQMQATDRSLCGVGTCTLCDYSATYNSLVVVSGWGCFFQRRIRVLCHRWLDGSWETIKQRWLNHAHHLYAQLSSEI